jgi:bifunctional DNA-binding transcriptional regulator/antitoxin component of YhaV-PrlF toxin-antitoxin module
VKEMWIKNTAVRTKAVNKSNETSYLIVNTTPKNPAIRVSEKAKQELGWDKGDFINLYVDSDKIILVRDNVSKEFPIRIYKSRDRNYGFNIYGAGIKVVCEKFGWVTNRDYLVEIHEKNDEKMLLCFKNEKMSRAEKALIEYTSTKILD